MESDSFPVSQSLEDLEAAAARLRDSCLDDPEHPDSDALQRLLAGVSAHDQERAVVSTRLLIGGVVEHLSDRFEPALAECYVSIFSKAIAACQPVWTAEFLAKRYRQLRLGSPPPASLPVEQVFVLSRITLGADIAVTSVFLDAALKRYPEARVWLVGPAKNFELFAGNPRLSHWPLEYPRGASLRERIQLAEELAGLCEEPGTLIIDPDSRITQLGLLPIGPATRTLFFESRTAESESDRTLSEIASSFCFLRLAVPDAMPFVALSETALDSQANQGTGTAAGDAQGSAITVSFGVGGNPEKRMGGDFEADLLRVIASFGRPIWIDAGAGGSEAERVRAAIASASLSGDQVRVLDGSFALFCSHIQRSALYIGYESAGQHAAAAMSVPGVTIFRGHLSERMFARWKPRGKHSQVVLVTDGSSPSKVLQDLRAAITQAIHPLG